MGQAQGQGEMVRTLFYPGGVIVFGVSSAPTNLARFIVNNLDRFRFRGPVYLVGRDGGSLNGRTIHERAGDVEGAPDLAVILLPAKAVPEALAAAADKGARHAVVLSGGFSEFGEERKTIEAKILEIAENRGIHFVGPNCLGLLNMENGLAVPFVPLEPRLIKKGSLSLLAQSGGVMLEGLKLFSQDTIGVNKLVSMGNKLDLNENDYLDYLIHDPGTKIVALYLENIAGGRRLMNLAGSTDKPIIVLKANTSSSSNEIARFHTSALAGDDLVADAAFRQAGIHRVQNMQDMMDNVKIFSLPLLRGANLALLCRSGGMAVMLADAVHRYGFKLANLSPSFFDLVRREVRAGVIRMTNPLDLGDVFNLPFYVQLMEKALQEETVDGLVISHSYVVAADIHPTRKIIAEAGRLCKTYGKPVVFCLIADREQCHRINHAEDFPVFQEVDRAVKALARLYDHSKVLAARAEGKGFTGLPGFRNRRKKIDMRHSGDLLAVLETYRLTPVDYSVVRSEEEALKQARRMGYPVALKTAALEIVHKTEAGGVTIGIAGPEALRKTFRAMRKALMRQGWASEPFILQKMAPRGQEVFIGGKQDPEFGPVILFGLGGIHVEVMKDVALRVAPIDERTAREMLDEIRGAALLRGFRGEPPSDRSALAKCLVRASRLIAEHPEIKNLDINPLMVLKKGEGCLVVDAKMEIAEIP